MTKQQIKKIKIQVNDQEAIVYYHYPTNKDLKGIVLFCHGFPGTTRLEKMAAELNKYGYTLVEINYRGDKESDGKFSFFGSIEDIKTVAKHLRQNYGATPLTALGYSAGGLYLTNIIRKQPQLFDKIVLLNPLLDASFTNTPLMDELWNEAARIIRLRSMKTYKDEMKKMNENYNPISFAKEITIPITIIQSTDDEVLPTDIVKNFYKQLRKPGKLLWIEGAKHDLYGDEPKLIKTLT